MKKRLKYILLTLLPVGLVLFAAFQRTAWDEPFTIEDGRVGTARFSDISWRYWGSPHVVSLGGETISCSATFCVDEHRSKWKSNRDERVFSVQFSLQRWYAISLDRTDGHKWVIRFYSGKDGDMLREIEPRDYPIKMAIQNLWLTDETVSLNSSFTSGDPQARFSFLARAWWKLLHTEDIAEVKPGFIEKVAAQEFPGRINFLPQQPNKSTAR